MFHRGFFVFRILAALLLVGVLIAGGYGLYRAGLSQGYVQGLAAADAAHASPSSPAQPAAPGLMPYYGYGYWYGPHFGLGFPFFGFFAVGALIFVTFLIVGSFARMRMMRHWMAGEGPWKEGHWHGGPWGYRYPEGKPGEPSQPAPPPANEPKP